MVDVIATGREAVRRNDWDEAVRSLTAADEQDALAPDDLMLLGDAYWWTGQPDAGIEAIERAYSGYLQAGDRSRAALAGALLSYFALRRMAMPVADAWMARVERLLADEPESAGHAWLALLNLARALLIEHDLRQTLDLADEVIDIGERLGIHGVQAQAMSFKGIALIQTGEIAKGTALIDEATVVAMSEGGDLRSVCDVYCNTIGACSTIGDYGRAQQWTDQAERWMHSQSAGGYTGICKVHRAELKRLHGAWSEAEQAAREACDELERFRLLDGVGFAYYEIGETRRRMGDLAAAEDSFQKAYEYGNNAQPGMSLLLLDRGEIEEAARSIAGAVARRAGATPEMSSSMLARGRLLPAQVEIAIRAGDIETARAAVEDLEAIAGEVQKRWWQASALTCRGSLELSQGNPETAVDALEHGWRMWSEIDLPYESALARAILGEAKIASGDERSGRLDLEVAANTFRGLGAAADVRRLSEITGGSVAHGERDRVTRVFMFTDIVTSTDLIGIIGDADWENLLRWHDRTLRALFGEHNGEEVRHTGDGFFVSFDLPRSAIDCAVAIQRSLNDHRRDHGFAPWVRIGIHIAEATRTESDYSGRGVHAAARIGGLGGRDDVVVSAAVLDAAGEIPYKSSDARQVELKGITEPVVVHDLDWH
ncbi:MAG TPA: adenylate/guanylate cyclase domain-containing protein [Acidimicrobiia bacterium]